MESKSTIPSYGYLLIQVNWIGNTRKQQRLAVSKLRFLTLKLSEHQGNIMTTKTERIRCGNANLVLAGLVRNIVQITFWIRVLIINRGRNNIIRKRKSCENCFDRAG